MPAKPKADPKPEAATFTQEQVDQLINAAVAKAEAKVPVQIVKETKVVPEVFQVVDTKVEQVQGGYVKVVTFSNGAVERTGISKEEYRQRLKGEFKPVKPQNAKKYEAEPLGFATKEPVVQDDD